MKKREHLAWKREDPLPSLPLTPLAIIKDLLCKRVDIAFVYFVLSPKHNSDSWSSASGKSVFTQTADLS